jgi:hypothetical protein
MKKDITKDESFFAEKLNLKLVYLSNILRLP